MRELMSVSLPSAEIAEPIASWAVVESYTLISLLSSDIDRILRFEFADSHVQIQSSRIETFEDIARELELVGFIRWTFGDGAFAGRLVNTVRACAWLSHVVQALFELVRVQDVQLHLVGPGSIAPPPLASAALLHSLREEHLLACVAHVDTAFRQSVSRRRELERELHVSEVNETEATRRYALLSSQLEDECSVIASLRSELADARQEHDMLRARVCELERQLDEGESMRQPMRGLSQQQAMHVFDFLWRYRCGQGETALWGELVRACALADASRAPLDVSLIVTRVRRSARFVQASPPASELDVV
ncbi:hypothetical protein PINS_up015127 [Pythium insidiosum]|nr:hypothetical protein PINS_up015127 [Pythium insidiosum]